MNDSSSSLATVPGSFAKLLFGGTAPEDLTVYTPAELATLARDAWSFLQVRKPGVAKLRFELPDASKGERLKSIGVIEIVNDDMPFLLDSVMGELTDRGIEVRLVAHPIVEVARDAAGQLTDAPRLAAGRAPGNRESLIHIHVDRVDDAARRGEIAQAIEQVLSQVRLSVEDWRAMRDRVAALVADMRANPPPLPVGEIAETAQFLEWLGDNNFTFLGLREYVLSVDGNRLDPKFDTGLGILRQREMRVLRRGREQLDYTPEILAFLKAPRALIVTKANVKSRVHRRAYMDYVGVKRFDAQGQLVGECRVVGLFTSTAYTRSPRAIPYIRRKVDAVVRRAGFDPDSHSGKALVNVLETYPRDELIQLDEDTLFEFALTILRLEERPRIRVLARRDQFDRFVSVLVYVPRERFDTGVRRRIGDYLAKVYQGHVSAFYPFFPEGALTRVHFIIGRNEGATPNPDRATLEADVAAIVRTWTDALNDALNEAHEPGNARALFERYRNAFTEGYHEAYAARDAVADIGVLERLTDDRPIGVTFYRRGDAAPSSVSLKIFNQKQPIPLSARVPVLENMGFRVVDEQTYQIEYGAAEGVDAWLHDMLLERTDGGAVDLDALKEPLEACFLMVMRGIAENDGYNALVLAVRMGWRDVALVRTVSRFLRQIRVPYSQDYMWATLRKHAGLAAKLVALFHARFDPRAGAAMDERGQKQTAILAEIEAALSEVDSLDEDRIVRHFVNAVQAAIRTNYYQVGADGQPKALIAIKFESKKVDGMPLPRPLYEIFVYSPRVEGVHMRFGKVARGGIRWSDRPQDFRTEILGLVKAQQVKNAVIVPVGSKGGYVPKHLPGIIAAGGGREAIQAEGTATYRLFISTLLDITDNLDLKGVIRPDNVVRYDDDDPYLVVAADKGTATFSDIANEISAQHDYWLGDAFASGGSAGYDHKGMGITARGAWEAVKRHFRELDTDITVTPFTMVGVGDMSGDVFGNGLLRESTTRLIAAFDHRDIFIDPDPDPAQSFAERARLFVQPRSSWQDYDKKLISKGGGVFSRQHKEIALSREAQNAIGLAKDKATPQEVMSSILKAPVDLLFFGGIGTYIRASTETDESVGDRANDPIRIAGKDLRCKVVGEGANLGMTQRGRIEAALKGVKLNTDAIDNSAGVNTSDVEVNIKIALSLPVRDGRLDIAARNKLLGAMTDEVASLVLRNNYLQTLALSLAERHGLEDMGFLQRLIQILEQRGELDRAVEFLPDDMAIAERVKQSVPFTRPELSVLLAYAKLSLYAELLDSSVPDDPYLGRELGRYFPKVLAEKYPDALEKHRLRREIIATQLANSMINRCGPSLTVRIADQTGASAAAIAAAFAAVRNSYDMPALNDEINALDGKISGKLQLSLYEAVQNLLLDRLVWFLRNVDLSKGLAGVVDHYRDGITKLEVVLAQALPADAAAARKARAAEFVKAGVPETLAQRIADLPELQAAPDLVLIVDRTNTPIESAFGIYAAAQAYFRIDRVVAAARQIAVSDYFDRLALDRALDAIGDAERRIAAAMVATGKSGAAAVESWVAPRRIEIERVRDSIHQIANSGLTLSKLSVAASLLGDLVKQ